MLNYPGGLKPCLGFMRRDHLFWRTYWELERFWTSSPAVPMVRASASTALQIGSWFRNGRFSHDAFNVF